MLRPSLSAVALGAALAVAAFVAGAAPVVAAWSVVVVGPGGAEDAALAALAAALVADCIPSGCDDLNPGEQLLDLDARGTPRCGRGW